GFKWIGKMIKAFPDLEFSGGGEESYGYLVGDFVRDKDAVTATLLACEIAAQKKGKGKTLTEYLDEIYSDFGTYGEHLISITKEGKEGAEEIQKMMHDFRENPLVEIAGSPVIQIDDIQKSERRNLIDSSTSVLDLPKSNVVIYYTEDGSKIAARPSGTEPKIKFYISVNTSEENADVVLQKKIDAIVSQLNLNA